MNHFHCDVGLTVYRCHSISYYYRLSLISERKLIPVFCVGWRQKTMTMHCTMCRVGVGKKQWKRIEYKSTSPLEWKSKREKAESSGSDCLCVYRKKCKLIWNAAVVTPVNWNIIPNVVHFNFKLQSTQPPLPPSSPPSPSPLWRLGIEFVWLSWYLCVLINIDEAMVVSMQILTWNVLGAKGEKHSYTIVAP